jgi:hypothetical protein
MKLSKLLIGMTLGFAALGASAQNVVI